MIPKNVVPRSEAEAVTQYQPFVVQTAKSFASSGVVWDDLMQEGLIAVALAFRTWREDGGANFLTWIRRPVYYAMLKLVRAQKNQGGSFRGGGPGARKGNTQARVVSLDTGWRRTHPNEYAPMSGTPGVALACEEDSHLSLHEKVGTFEEPKDVFALGSLPALVSRLGARERKVLRLHYEKRLSYEEIGKRLKISRERVRQLKKKALARLKELMMNGEKVES